LFRGTLGVKRCWETLQKESKMSLYGNSIWVWGSGVIVAAAVFVTLWYIKCCGLKKITSIAQHIHAPWVKLLIETIQGTRLVLLFIVAVYAGAQVLALPAHVENILHMIFIITLLVQAGLWIDHYLGAWTKEYRAQQIKTNPAAVTTAGAMRLVLQIALWALIFLLILDNMGFNITTLLAGIGIGGAAVALAAQGILGDLFSSLSIVTDKTFVLGDYLTIGDLSGTVEYIGLKNTRIRSLSGEQIIFSNTDLLSSRIRNFGPMQERRFQAQFHVSYGIDQSKLEKVSGIIRSIIETYEESRLDYAHVTTYRDSGFEIEYAYYVKSPHYHYFLQSNENIIFRIVRAFREEGIDFAYPVRTLHVAEMPLVSPTKEVITRTGEELG
jgi:small-conductance mechanosensitive channel